MEEYNYQKKIYNKKKNKIILFKADWCIYCKQFENTWKKLQNLKKIKNVKFITYDEQKNNDKFKKYNIESFPTILLQKNNIITKYEGNRNINDLTTFILSS